MQAIPINQDNSPEAVLDLLYRIKVKEVMAHPILTAKPSDSLRSIQQVMKANHISGMPIADDNRSLLGIVSMDDIVNGLDNDWMDDPVALHMTANVIVLEEDMSLAFAVSYFNKYTYSRFPVLDRQSRIVGMVTASDVLANLIVALNKEVERLEHGVAAQASLSGAGDLSASGQSPRAANAGAATGETSSGQPVHAQATGPILPGHARESAGPNGERVIEYRTEPFNFEIAGRASTDIKKLLKAKGVDAAVTRRVGIASYELEINQVIHSQGGVMRYVLAGDRLTVEAEDEGPGIADIDKAMTEGFSTASDRVRSLGFGAGMGLPNTRRVSDEFSIESAPGKGTFVRASFMLQGGNA
jgi:CBS domain-containing protein